MASAALHSSRDLRAGLPFALAALAVGGLSAFLAGWLPLGFSIVTVFLFAGPHNWLEVRYFMGRMPARWGRLRGYFFFAFAGIFGLTAVYAGIAAWSGTLRWGAADFAVITVANLVSFGVGEVAHRMGWFAPG